MPRTANLLMWNCFWHEISIKNKIRPLAISEHKNSAKKRQSLLWIANQNREQVNKKLSFQIIIQGSSTKGFYSAYFTKSPLQLIKQMNQIYIGQPQQQNNQPNTFAIAFDQADKYLQILRNDHFAKVIISLPQNITDKQLRFMMHLSRILKAKGQIHLSNQEDSAAVKVFRDLAQKLGLFQNRDGQGHLFFSKQKPQQNGVERSLEIKKSSIGFQAHNESEQIDQDQLMKNENINIQKSKIQNCAQKPKACANCNCGRKNNQQTLVPKQKLIESINQGKPVSGCGKCFLGDSFRCGSCPYKGLPAFKPGDKLKLMEEGQVVVEANQVKVESGKVKIQL